MGLPRAEGNRNYPTWASSLAAMKSSHMWEGVARFLAFELLPDSPAGSQSLESLTRPCSAAWRPWVNVEHSRWWGGWKSTEFIVTIPGDLPGDSVETAGRTSLIPDPATMILHSARCGQKIKQLWTSNILFSVFLQPSIGNLKKKKKFCLRKNQNSWLQVLA